MDIIEWLFSVIHPLICSAESPKYNTTGYKMRKTITEWNFSVSFFVNVISDNSGFHDELAIFMNEPVYYASLWDDCSFNRPSICRIATMADINHWPRQFNNNVR